MTEADKYRANARHCLCKADKEPDSKDKQTWLNMADTWLGMIPAAQRSPGETFDRTVRDQDTQQDPSKIRH